MVTDFSVRPLGNVTVCRTAHVDAAGLRSYLEDLLRGLVAGGSIEIVEPPCGAGSTDRESVLSPFIVPLRSALPRRPPYIDVIVTAGAMLICATVVLNVGPFATTARPVAGVPAPASPSAPAARETAHPERFQAAFEPAEVAKPVMALAQLRWPLLDGVVSAQAPQTEGETGWQAVPPSTPPAQSDSGTSEAAANTIVGVWAPDAARCSADRFRDGTLPTVITTDGAWAGDTFCLFTKQQQTEAGWRVVAKCSNPKERWTSNVRLTVSDGKLTWTSKRGVQAYARCTPDVLMARR
jgi:hypothetical protein